MEEHISGYSDYFCNISKDLQQNVIDLGRSLRFDDVIYDWVASTRINLLIFSPKVFFDVSLKCTQTT